ncbi:alpha/beta fold hydrolase [Rhodobacteraceae bacterium D3-12]|nr:alpha/beta fold hydrolase [Rhodobacteraceae bacterium D3-12]
MDADHITADHITIETGGGPIEALYYRSPKATTVAVLNPATGVPQRYYRHFATWLTDQGISCLTYDYRGFGASARGPIQDVRLSMADWGIHDQQAARDWLSEDRPGLPLWVIGHSLGGFMLGYQTGLERIARVIAVCSGPIHHSDHPWPYQASARFFWFALGPALLATTSYLPGRFSGLGADVPGPVFRQWKRWCTTRGFHLADKSLPAHDASALTAELRTVSPLDDEMIPPHVVEKLAMFYPEAAQTHVVLDPKAYGLGKVGHLAMFAKRNAALWPAMVGIDSAV